MSLWIVRQNRRLDQELASQWEGWSRNSVRLWLERGTTLVNQRKATTRTRVETGDHITLNEPWPRLEEFPTPSPWLPLSLLQESEEWLAVEKPAGLPCHPLHPWDRESVVQALLAQKPELRGIGSLRESGLLHRLDNETSGVLLFAKTQESWKHLRELWTQRRWEKCYWAWVEGSFSSGQTLTTPIQHHPKSKKRMQIVPDNARSHRGQEAISHIEILEQRAEQTLVQVQIETGVRHQIRVHLASLGHPIVGDELYGAKQNASRMLLHASSLRLHSFDGQTPLFVQSSVSLESWKREC